jgi:hypothetical protein
MPWHKQVSKVQQGCLARGETEAVEIDIDMNTALSRASWLIGMDLAKGRQVSVRLPHKKNRTS